MKKCSRCGLQPNQYLSEEEFVQIDDQDLCPFCANRKLKEENKQIPTNESNPIGSLVQNFGFIIFIVGCVLSFFQGGLLTFFTSLTTAILFLGFGELIIITSRILNEIKSQKR